MIKIDRFSVGRLLLHYDFTGVSSTIVPDLTGNGYTGVIRGCDRGGADIDTDSVFGRSLSVLCLTGGENGGFLQMPEGILNDTAGFTISFYCRLGKTEECCSVFSLGRDRCFYLTAKPDPDAPDGLLLSLHATSGGRSQEVGTDRYAAVRTGRWYHIAASFGGEPDAAGTLWLDGKPAGSFRHAHMDQDSLKDAADCFFGNGIFSPSPIRASFADIRILNGVLSEKEISSLFHIDPTARLQMECDFLKTLFEKPLQTLPSLPALGVYGADIRWHLRTPEILAGSGKLRRPSAGCPAAKAVWEAELSYNGIRRSEIFRSEILPLPSDLEIARADAMAFSIPFPGHVAEDLALPQSGTAGSVFSWTSSAPERIASDGHILDRPSKEPVRLTLSLVSVYGNASFTRVFPITLLPDHCRSLPHRAYIPAAECGTAVPVPAAQPVPMERVSLSSGSIFYENQSRCLDYLLLLDTDRMLYNFRKTFGVSTRGVRPLGGWEEPAGLLRGHSTGHFLSALARAFAATGDERYREKARTIIKEFLSLQSLSQGDPAAFRTACTPSHAVQSLWSHDPKTWGKGFLSAYPPDQFALLERFTPYATIWAPYYTLHKILAGLLDCFCLLRDEDALTCARGIGDWICRRLQATTESQRAEMWRMYIAGEYGGMNESLASLYRLTKEPAYLSAAQMFDNPSLFIGLSHGRDPLKGIHANQHIPQIIGAMEEFAAAKDPAYYHLARNFWELVVNRYMYSIGGVGRGENFREPNILAGNIEGGRNCETCATYNLLKLTGMLYRYAPEHSCYMDYYERALYNHIAASQNPERKPGAHHGVTYMLPIGPGARREYSDDYDDFTCCHGTGMENHVRYTEEIYHQGLDGCLYVNLFLPSVYRWEEKGAVLSLESAFPAESFRLTVHFTEKGAPESLRLHLRIRIPDWCRTSFRIRLNGRELPAPAGDKGYYGIDREFADGDSITVYTPYSIRLCYTDDSYEGYPAASLMYGPFVMTALCDRTEWIMLNIPPIPEDAFEIRWASGPVLRYDDLVFVPSYLAHNTAYHTYFKINLI